MRAFSPLLLRLHREISLSLHCLHSSWGSALVLAPPLHVGHPLASVPHTDVRALKQRLISVLLFAQDGERERYGSHNFDVGNACCGRGQHEVATASGALCVLPGNLALDHGTLAVACCIGSQEGVGSDLRLHTGSLVAMVAVVAVPASCGALASFRLSSHSQPQSPPWGLIYEA